MPAAERRLAAVTRSLTARERAVLWWRSWVRGERPDERLRLYMPEDQRPAFEHILLTLEETDVVFVTSLIVWTEWIIHLDTLLGWAQSLHAFQAREAILRRALKAAGVAVRERPRDGALVLPVLPRPGPGFIHGLQRLSDDDISPRSEPPRDWRAAAAWLDSNLRRGIVLRWQELTAHEAIVAELHDHFGEQVVREAALVSAASLRAKVLTLHQAACALLGPFPLPDPDAAMLAVARGRVDWAALGRAPADARGSEAQGRAQAEAEWAAQLGRQL